jgi:two-component system phosphate regulon sensor histidine kinase PhoR
LQDFWFRLIAPIGFGALVALMLWGMFSATAAALFMLAAALVIMALHAWQLYKLGRWLKDARLETMPEAGGIWDDVFSRLYKMVKQHNQTKQELAAELQHIEQAAAALPEGVAILNEANRIEWCNPLAQKHFDLDVQHDLMQDITYLVRQPEFIEYIHGSSFSEPLVMRPARHDGLVLSIKLVSYGGNKRLLISRDITQLERIETMRRDFVANVSHELRTPLTVVSGFVENLQDMPDIGSDSAQQILRLTGEQTKRMENLVADLLTLSRLENDQNPLHEESIDMKAMLGEIYQDGMLLSGGSHTLSMEMPSDAKLLGNREELRSAFGNLLSNAIRYTPAGGAILLRWSERAGQPVFSVRDSGIGINAQHIPRLTERFYRVDRSRSRETGGTGLGLAIVKHIAMRHQASLEVLSEEGKGSTFSLVFPVKRRA